MPEHPDRTASAGWSSRIGLVAGPAVAALLLALDLEPARPSIGATAAVAAWMAIWWITEAVPLAVTALLPVVLFPSLGVMPGGAVASHYFNHVIFLFIGGFIVALAMERWNLHRRIALRILLAFGAHPRSILAGFMIATWFLSMWISNTAATMMMVTIVLAVIARVESRDDSGALGRFAIGLLLGTAYAASIGGIATLVGTPPNLSFVRIFEIQFPDAPPIGFASWLFFALPISVTLLAITWALLAWRFAPPPGALHLDRETFREHYAALGRPSWAERVVLVDFAVLVVLWLTRADLTVGSLTLPGWSRLFPQPGFLNDGTVAVALAVALFLIPSRAGDGGRVMDWTTASRLPWHIVLLFGGGFALAAAFDHGGLSTWMGERLDAAGALPPIVMVAVLCVALTFLTELTSNTATTEMILPVLAGLAVAIGVDPLLVMVPVTVSCSCAFMMPVATPPNALVFASGRLRVADMARVGFVLNLIGTVLIVAATFTLGRWVLGIDLDGIPAWAGEGR